MSAQLKQHQEVFLVYDFDKDLYARKKEGSYNRLDWVTREKATSWTSRGALKNSFNSGVLRRVKNSKFLVIETCHVSFTTLQNETLWSFMEKNKK